MSTTYPTEPHWPATPDGWCRLKPTTWPTWVRQADGLRMVRMDHKPNGLRVYAPDGNSMWPMFTDIDPEGGTNYLVAQAKVNAEHPAPVPTQRRYPGWTHTPGELNLVWTRNADGLRLCSHRWPTPSLAYYDSTGNTPKDRPTVDLRNLGDDEHAAMARLDRLLPALNKGWTINDLCDRATSPKGAVYTYTNECKGWYGRAGQFDTLAETMNAEDNLARARVLARPLSMCGKRWYYNVVHDEVLLQGDARLARARTAVWAMPGGPTQPTPPAAKVKRLYLTLPAHGLTTADAIEQLHQQLRTLGVDPVKGHDHTSVNKQGVVTVFWSRAGGQ